MDPVVQDIKRHGIEESKYQKAFEALREIVKEDYCLFESFLMDEYPDIYEEINDLHSIHNSYCWAIAHNRVDHIEGMWLKVFNKWLEYVDRETERRIL